MGEFASRVAATLLGKIGSIAYQEIALAWGLKGDVERLGDTTRIISAFLVDAENKQFTTNHSITEWLRQLKHAFYDASDLLEKIECEAKLNEMVKSHRSVARKVRQFFSGSNPLVFRLIMAHKIKVTREKIDEIGSNRIKFGLTEHHANDMALNRRLSWRETHSSVPSRVTGRDKEKEKIVRFLTSPPMQSQVKNIRVFPIVGMGGLGKTTVAQLAYNDKRVVDHFHLRMWVHVGDDFDVKMLTSKILKAVDRTNRCDDNSSLDELQTLLCEKLNGKKFVLVLDDVWDENAKIWDELRDILLGTIDESNPNDCKIVVTTRSHKVAFIMGTTLEFNLEQLPEEECLKLFVKCTFQAGEEEADRYPRLKKIGKEIVKKCKGVPLAVVTLGCLLKSQRDEKEWKSIQDSEIWEIDDGILPALRLSYTKLPCNLRQCFSYCAHFPKNYRYSSRDLISFWMAHGLLHPTKENQEPEYLGELYLNQLISASFFRVLATDEDLPFELWTIMSMDLYQMRDLVHDLAMWTLQDEQAVISSNTTNVNEKGEQAVISSNTPNVNKKVRHLSISNGDRVPSLPHKLNMVRAFGIFFSDERRRITVTEPFLEWIFKELKCLRVLYLQGSNFQLLPDCLDNMKYLRHLNLMTCDNMEKLPDSICKLHNLQSLNLSGCRALQELPKNMGNLVSLRTLSITARVKDLNSIDVKCFKFLQNLFIVSCENLVVLPRDLRHLIALKRLIIMGCKNLQLFEEVGTEQNEVDVKDLSLQTFAVLGASQLTALPSWLERSAKTLQNMVIVGTGLRKLPEWLPKLTSLDTLYISFCPMLLRLPRHINRPSTLQHLYIRGCPKLAAAYGKDKGPRWREIAHVPNVHID